MAGDELIRCIIDIVGRSASTAAAAAAAGAGEGTAAAATAAAAAAAGASALGRPAASWRDTQQFYHHQHTSSKQ